MAVLICDLSSLGAGIEVGLVEVLDDLRHQGWTLIGAGGAPRPLSELPRQAPPADGIDPATVFDRVLPVPDLPGADPRRFAFLLRESGTGPKIYVDDRPECVAAARRAGLDAHLYRGAAGLRAACMSSSVGV